MIQEFYAHGKLMLTGEYYALNGALVLAFPTKLGQSMKVHQPENATPKRFPRLNWTAYTHTQEKWLEHSFLLAELDLGRCEYHKILKTKSFLCNIICSAKSIAGQFPWNMTKDIAIDTHLEFHRDWGLGSSSTMIHNLATYFKIDPYALQYANFGGSAYDIACAGAEGPILYRKGEEDSTTEAVTFSPPYLDQLYLVHLKQKQNSREGIKHFKAQAPSDQITTIATLDQLTKAILEAKTLSEFEDLLDEYEDIISTQLKMPKVKDRLFADYWGSCRSLGAWGGDMILVTSDRSEATTKAYFQSKGYNTFISFQEMVIL